MKTIIIYDTKYGFTKEVAEFIKEEINDVDFYSVNDEESFNLKLYDNVYLCGYIIYGEVSVKIVELLRKNKVVLLDKNIKLFCSALDQIDFTKAIQTSLDPEMFLHMKVFNSGGRIVWDELTFIEKRKIKRRLKIKTDIEVFDKEEIRKYITL